MHQPKLMQWALPYRKVLWIWGLFLVTSYWVGLYIADHRSELAPTLAYTDSWHVHLCRVDCFTEDWVVREWYHRYPPLAVKFPLMAGTARLVSQTTGLATTFAVFILAKIGMWAGFAELWRLTAKEKDGQTAQRAVGWMAFGYLLTGYVWIVPYPEGWQLAFTALAINYYGHKRYGWVGVFAGLLTLTRPQGVLIAPALALGLVLQGDLQGWGTKLKRILQTCLPPMMTWGLWMLEAERLTHVAFAPIKLQEKYARPIALPHLALARFFDRWVFSGEFLDNVGIPLIVLQLLLIGIALILLTKRTFEKKLAPEWVLLSWLTLWVCLSTTPFSIGRFMLISPVAWVVIYLPDRWQPTVKKIEPYVWTVIFGLTLVWTVVIFTDLAIESWVFYLP